MPTGASGAAEAPRAGVGRRFLPHTLRGQFSLALTVLALLVVAVGATAVYALRTANDATSRLAEEQLVRMQNAQSMLLRTLQIERQAGRLLTAGSLDAVRASYGDIVRLLDGFDAQVEALAAASQNIDVLDLHQSSQLFRNTANIVAQLREAALVTEADFTQALGRRTALLRSARLQPLGNLLYRLQGVADSGEAYRLQAEFVRLAAGTGDLPPLVRADLAALRTQSAEAIDPEAGDPFSLRRRLLNEEDVLRRFHGELAGQGEAIVAAARQQSSHFTGEYQAALARLVDISTHIERWVLALVAVSLALAWLIARVFLGRHVLARLQQVSDCLRDDRSGAGEAVVPVHGHDEIGAMARAVEQFLRDRQQLEEKSAELRIAKDRAEVANQAKSTFLSSMSHELRTPLNGILGYAQILGQSTGLDMRQKAGVDTIQQSGQHLLTLIDDLLDLAKIEAGKYELAPTALNLPPLLAMVCNTIRVKADEKDLLFACECSPDLPSAVMADGKRLRQILLNLLGNAVKFTDRGRVALQVEPRAIRDGAATLRFTVADSGIGMSAAQQQELFKPFSQVGEAHRRSGGTGLGLAISRQLVNLMGGDIHLASEPGAGSRFWFELTLPLCVAQADRVEAGWSAGGYVGVRRKVLVADDVASNRALLSDLLGGLGFDICQAADGEQAIEQVAAASPDLVLMDLVMPEVDGLEAIRRIRRMPGKERLPIIVLSASANQDDQDDAAAAGADGFAAKPIDQDKLLPKLGELLGLTWLPGETESPAVIDAAAATSLPVPQQELEALHLAARAGNMRAIRRQAEHLAALDEGYRPFADTLLRLAHGYQSKAVLALIEARMP